MIKTSSSRKNAPEATAETREQLARELKALRSLFRDIVMRYQTNMEAKILTCVDRLSPSNDEPLSADASNLKTLQSLLSDIENLKLKPRKGRLKDIRRIDAAIEKISEILTPQ